MQWELHEIRHKLHKERKNKTYSHKIQLDFATIARESDRVAFQPVPEIPAKYYLRRPEIQQCHLVIYCRFSRIRKLQPDGIECHSGCHHVLLIKYSILIYKRGHYALLYQALNEQTTIFELLSFQSRHIQIKQFQGVN